LRSQSGSQQLKEKTQKTSETSRNESITGTSSGIPQAVEASVTASGPSIPQAVEAIVSASGSGIPQAIEAIVTASGSSIPQAIEAETPESEDIVIKKKIEHVASLLATDAEYDMHENNGDNGSRNSGYDYSLRLDSEESGRESWNDPFAAISSDDDIIPI
jgi:hypothetical protein